MRLRAILKGRVVIWQNFLVRYMMKPVESPPCRALTGVLVNSARLLQRPPKQRVSDLPPLRRCSVRRPWPFRRAHNPDLCRTNSFFFFHQVTAGPDGARSPIVFQKLFPMVLLARL